MYVCVPWCETTAEPDVQNTELVSGLRHLAPLGATLPDKNEKGHRKIQSCGYLKDKYEVSKQDVEGHRHPRAVPECFNAVASPPLESVCNGRKDRACRDLI